MADPESGTPAPVVGVGVDANRVYSSTEERALTLNLHELAATAYSGQFKAFPLALETLCGIHGKLFRGVREHAGRHRTADWGSEYLTFGPNRSAHRSEVHRRLTEIFAQLALSLNSFDQNPDAPDYERSALALVAWTQAEIIGVHAFEDGNGRSTRLFCDLVLMRLGLSPLPLEGVKDEYNECLNEYFRSKNINKFVGLLIRLYVLE